MLICDNSSSKTKHRSRNEGMNPTSLLRIRLTRKQHKIKGKWK